jgi:hypothetical protein
MKIYCTLWASAVFVRICGWRQICSDRSLDSNLVSGEMMIIAHLKVGQYSSLLLLSNAIASRILFQIFQTTVIFFDTLDAPQLLTTTTGRLKPSICLPV